MLPNRPKRKKKLETSYTAPGCGNLRLRLHVLKKKGKFLLLPRLWYGRPQIRRLLEMQRHRLRRLQKSRRLLRVLIKMGKFR